MISPGLELLRTSSEAQDFFAQVTAEEDGSADPAAFTPRSAPQPRARVR